MARISLSMMARLKRRAYLGMKLRNIKLNKGQMPKAEIMLLEFIHNNITYIFLAFIILLSIVIRYSFRDSMNTDLEDYLAWYDGIKANGGLFGGLHL